MNNYNKPKRVNILLTEGLHEGITKILDLEIDRPSLSGWFRKICKHVIKKHDDIEKNDSTSPNNVNTGENI